MLPKQQPSRAAVVVVYFAFLVLSLVFCRRFFDLTDPTSHHLLVGDSALNAWALDWVTHALKTQPSSILDGNTFFPYPKSVALSEHMLSLALINVFVNPFSWSPWFGYNFLVFLSYFASAIGGFLLVREWTGSVRAAIWAGVFWAFLFFRVHHMSHLQILSFEWMPFCVLFLLRAERDASLKNWAAFIFFFLMQALVSWYLAVITTFLVIVVIASTIDSAMLNKRRALLAIGAAALCAAPLIALAVPYSAVSAASTLGERFQSVLSVGGTDLLRFFAHYLFPPDATVIGSRIPGNRHQVWGENTLYIGYVPLVLSAIALFRRQDYGTRLMKAGMALVVVGAVSAVGFVTVSGLKLPLYYLAKIVPPLAGLRAPQRFSLLIYFGVMLLSSLALAQFERRTPKPRLPSVIVAAACGIFLLEVYPVKLPYDTHGKFEYSVIDRAIDRIQNEMGHRIAAIHYPIYAGADPYPIFEGAYMLGSTLHHAAIVNGFSGAEPKGWIEDLRIYNQIPDPRAFALLRERHVDLICLHPEVPAELRQRIVERFEESGIGDVLLSDTAGNVILRLRLG